MRQDGSGLRRALIGRKPGSHETRRWREMDSNFWYRGTKTVDSGSIPRIAGMGRTLKRST
jgi:hypothetical protein